MTQWPHDDNASLITFYGQPWEDLSLLTHVAPPFVMRYEGAQVHGILIHVKCSDALNAALNAAWVHYGHDQAQIDASGLSNYSGSYNYRTVRGATNLSCHAFGAALDIDAEHNPMYYNPNVGLPLRPPCAMPQPVVDAFNTVGATWGGTFLHRVDKMHFQFAHE
jgi:D-alanyl-D-alanine carboxypeptidase